MIDNQNDALWNLQRNRKGGCVSGRRGQGTEHQLLAAPSKNPIIFIPRAASAEPGESIPRTGS